MADRVGGGGGMPCRPDARTLGGGGGHALAEPLHQPLQAVTRQYRSTATFDHLISIPMSQSAGTGLGTR